MTVQLAAGLVERVLSCYPLPIATGAPLHVLVGYDLERRDSARLGPDDTGLGGRAPRQRGPIEVLASPAPKRHLSPTS